ncbi:hypothetical protein GCM10008940_08560 [Microbulbifer agarilyticus]
MSAIHLAAAPVRAGHRVPFNLEVKFTDFSITGRSHAITRNYTTIASRQFGAHLNYKISNYAGCGTLRPLLKLRGQLGHMEAPRNVKPFTTL